MDQKWGLNFILEREGVPRGKRPDKFPFSSKILKSPQVGIDELG